MFFTDDRPGSIPIHLVHEDRFDEWLAAQNDATRHWVGANHFRGERHKIVLLPGSQGLPSAVFAGMGRHGPREELSLWHSAALPDRLPEGDYHLAEALGSRSATQFALGWAYGQYKFERYRRASPARSVQLKLPAGLQVAEIERLRSATALARDLINTPANDMSPEHLARVAAELAKRYGARHRIIVGDDLLTEGFPAVHAVGRASSCAPRLFDMEWGDAAHPKVTLVGKGVCFDTGGLDIKPGSSMLLMKKDMGGAAVAIGLAQSIMDAKLPLRLRLIVPMVENAISANAYRPGDVLHTRKHLSVEIGNTDAEGRLILCDALALADEDKPDLLIDFATLTGAARVALGPELPALFCSDESLGAELTKLGITEFDPLWPMPLWGGYDEELSSKIADLNNVSTSGFAGAIIAALFLRRFVSHARAWVHVDLYAWNGKERAGRPVGGEPQALRAMFAYLKSRYSR